MNSLVGQNLEYNPFHDEGRPLPIPTYTTPVTTPQAGAPTNEEYVDSEGPPENQETSEVESNTEDDDGDWSEEEDDVESSEGLPATTEMGSQTEPEETPSVVNTDEIPELLADDDEEAPEEPPETAEMGSQTVSEEAFGDGGYDLNDDEHFERWREQTLTQEQYEAMVAEAHRLEDLSFMNDHIEALGKETSKEKVCEIMRKMSGIFKTAKPSELELLAKTDMTPVLDDAFRIMMTYSDLEVWAEVFVLLIQLKLLDSKLTLTLEDQRKFFIKHCHEEVSAQVLEFNLRILERVAPKRKQPDELEEDLQKAFELCIEKRQELPKPSLAIILSMTERRYFHVTRSNSQKIGDFLTYFSEHWPTSSSETADIFYTDSLVPCLLNIYRRARANPVIVRNITTPILVKKLYDMWKNQVVGILAQHSLIQILSIIAVHSAVHSKALMDMKIVHTLVIFYNQYSSQPEISQLNLCTLLWALMPDLPDLEVAKRNDKMRDELLKPYPHSTWFKKIEEDKCIPFTPKLSHFIETMRRKRLRHLNLIDAGSVCTLDIKENLLTNQSTLKQTATGVKRFTTKGLLKLKKTKRDPFRMPSKFVSFVYRFLCRRLTFHTALDEQYMIMETFLALFENITRKQHFKILLERKPRINEVALERPAENENEEDDDDEEGVAETENNPETQIDPYDFSADVFVASLTNELSFNLIGSRFGMQIFATLHRRFPETYNDLCKKYGVLQQICSAFKIKECIKLFLDANGQRVKETQPNPSPENLTWEQHIQRQVDELLKDLIWRKAFVRYIDFVFVEKNSGKEADYTSTLVKLKRALLEIDTPNDEFQKTLVLEALRCLLFRSLRDKGEEFLNVFLEVKEGEISAEPFRKLVQKMLDLLKFFFRADQRKYTWPLDYTTDTIYRAGINTIKHIATKSFKLQLIEKSKKQVCFEEDVYPFTTVQYLEYFMSHVMSSTSEYKDWNITPGKMELYIGEKLLPMNITVYEAIRKFEPFRDDIFKELHIIFFTKAEPEKELEAKRTPNNSITFDMTLNDTKLQVTLDILQMLNILNRYGGRLYRQSGRDNFIDPWEFVSPYMEIYTRKTLLDPLNVLRGNIPAWMDILKKHPFLFSYPIRQLAFRVLCLDRHRALTTVLSRHSVYYDAFSLDTRYPLISFRRDNLLDQVGEVLKQTRSLSNWNVLFSGESGSGVGVKRDMYTEISRQLQQADLCIWAASEDEVTRSGYVHTQAGLYPDYNIKATQKSGKVFSQASLVEKFTIIGQIMGKALLDGLLLPLPLAQPIFKWLLDEEDIFTVDDLQYVNPPIYNLLKSIQNVIDKKDIEKLDKIDPKMKEILLRRIPEDDEFIESLYLSFVLPRHDVDLIPNGSDILVTAENAEHYLRKMTDFILKTGVRTSMNALRRGFHEIVDVNTLKLFDPAELRSLLCGEDYEEYWTVNHLKTYVRISKFAKDSREVKDTFEILSKLNKDERNKFLEFATACPRLPPNGFAGLEPFFTIASLPSVRSAYVQTCFNRLHLPIGISKEKLEQFIRLGINEGCGHFGLA